MSSGSKRSILAVGALLCFGVAALGQDVSPAHVTEALEQSLVGAIATAERSVVAVARVRRERAADAAQPVFPRPFGGQGVPPTDPDFVPSEFGAGVAIGARQVQFRLGFNW